MAKRKQNDEDAGRRELEMDDRRFIWHPFTQMQEYEAATPLIIERGKGPYLYDIHGRRYLDGVSSLWVTVHGHRKPALDSAVRKQLNKVAHSTLLGISNVPAIKLAKMLVERAPEGLEKVFYSDNGSTAVEIGLKMAFQFWQQEPSGKHRHKTKFICFENAYHGDTIGSVGVGGIDLFHKLYRPLLMDSIRVKAPYCYRCPWELERNTCGLACTEEVERALQKHAHETAALIIESLVFAAAGMIMQPRGYLKKVRELCSQYEVFMIADEVAVGMGRTGTLFACEQEGVSPDILAIAKGLSGGYLPVAATLTTEQVYSGFLGDYAAMRTLFHGHTYTGNPLGCAASVANLEIFDREHTLKKVRKKIQALEELLRPLTKMPHVGDIRQCGLMVGIELVKDKETREPYDYAEKIGHKVIIETRHRGMIIRPLGDVVVLMPHLSFTRRQLERMVQITQKSIEAVTSG